MLDNSLKQHLTKRSPVIFKDVIAGFDTEYVNKDLYENELLTAQLSSTGVMKVFVPVLKPFVFEGVNTLTSENYLKSGPLFSGKDSLELWFRNSLLENRLLKFGSYDNSLNILINWFKEYIYDIENYNYSKQAGGYIFQFKKYPVQNTFVVPESGEILKISFDKLIDIVYQASHYPLVDLLKYLIEIKDRTNFKTFNNVFNSAEKFKLAWDGLSYKYNNNLKTLVWSNKDNKDFKAKDIKAEKSMVWVIDSVKINWIVKENVYLACHYNSADLTMLSDWFEKLNKNIDIIKKSYMSLAKPLTINGHNVYIRDTVLLASQLAGKLEMLGKMHKILKVPLSLKEIQNMDQLYKDNIRKFKAYAMQDSLITLIHSLFMNDFAFKMGKLVLPCTLGELASRYLKQKWSEDGYRGYQIDNEYQLGNMQVVLEVDVTNVFLSE
ncbi:hypothetical protein HOY82DRAFT_544414 [Tuber indicum]|nr:hypothetical protein HOY82DRAFT_544414 [Tuber indicum]